MILADTDVLIDYLNGVQPMAGRIRQYAQGNRLRTSAITCFELLSGAGQDKRGDDVRQFIANMQVLPLDIESAAQAAAVRRGLKAKGFSIGMGDSLIAGTALANGMQLLTRNRKHFQHVEGLEVV